MGCKSTTVLTRDQAERWCVEAMLEDASLKRRLRSEVVLMSNEDLECKLEELNDAKFSGGGFDNYSIEG